MTDYFKDEGGSILQFVWIKSAICHPQSAIVLLSAFSFLLLSCKVGPNYRRPPLSTPAAFKSATSAEKAESRLGRDWWTLFHDPDLSPLMEEALRANQNLAAAMARVAEAREATVAVRSQFYPVVTLNPSASRSRFPAGVRASSLGTGGGTGGTNPTPTPTPTPTPGVASPLASSTTGGVTPTPTPSVARVNLYQIPFDLTYEVDIWGRVRRSVEASEAQSRVSLYDLEVVRQTLLADLAQDYFNLRSFEELERITTRNVELYRQQLELVELQFKSGLVSEASVWQVRTLLDATEAQQFDYRRQRADLEHAIAVLLGRPPAEFTLNARPFSPAQPLIPAGLPADLLRRRPDVAEAEQNLIAASAQIGVAQANLYPAIRLTASAGMEATSLDQLAKWKNHFWTFGSNVAAPIFQGGLLRANLRQAQARYRELEATYRNTVLGAFRDVEDALSDLHLRTAEAVAQAQAVASARQYLQLTQEQYRAGFISSLQVIDADRSLLVNEIAQEQASNQRMVSMVLLIKALGGGWEALGNIKKK